MLGGFLLILRVLHADATNQRNARGICVLEIAAEAATPPPPLMECNDPVWVRQFLVCRRNKCLLSMRATFDHEIEIEPSTESRLA